RRGLPALLLADVAGQLAGLAGDLLLLPHQLLGRVPRRRVGLTGQLALGLRHLAAQLTLFLRQLACLLALLTIRQSLRTCRLLLALLRPLGLGGLLRQLTSEVLQRPGRLFLPALSLGRVVLRQCSLGLVHRLPCLLQGLLILVGRELRRLLIEPLLLLADAL